MKKPSVTSLLITLLLAAAVCTHGHEPEPVKDTDGNIVRVGEQYSIELVNTKSNGGVIPATINFTYCVNDIIQAPNQPGVPVSLAFPHFISPTLDILTNIDITIKFNFKSNVCKDIPMFWEVRKLPYPNPQTAIIIGGNPKEQKSHFKIEKVGEEETKVYKLRTFNGAAVGARPGPRNGALQLVLAKDTDEIILVKFNKVNDEKLGLRMFPTY